MQKGTLIGLIRMILVYFRVSIYANIISNIQVIWKNMEDST